MDYLLPIPDAEGIAKTKEIYLNQFGMTITDEQAGDILGRVMRYLYLTSELCSDTHSTHANPKTTKAGS